MDSDDDFDDEMLELVDKIEKEHNAKKSLVSVSCYLAKNNDFNDLSS